MSVSTHVRRAAPADLKAVDELYKMVEREHAEFEPSLARGKGYEQRQRDIQYAVDDPDSLLCVSTEGGSVTGFVMATFIGNRPDVVIQAIAVKPQLRRRGLGRALMLEVERWMKQKRGRYLELDVYDFNSEARAFYESLGYISYSRKLRKAPAFQMP